MISHYKKILMTALMLSVSSTWAGVMGSPPPVSNYEGFYVGGMLGVTDLAEKQEYMINPGSAQLGSMGFLGGLFVGYDFIFYNDFNVEIEGFGNGIGGLRATVNKTTLPSVSCTSSGLTTTVNYSAPSSSSFSVSTPYSAGVRILPGFQIREGGQFHFIAGWIYSTFNVADNGNHGIVNRSFSGSGFQSGLGWETHLANPLLLRIDMLYNIFGTYDVVGKGLAGSSALSQTYQMTPSTLDGAISLLWLF